MRLLSKSLANANKQTISARVVAFWRSSVPVWSGKLLGWPQLCHHYTGTDLGVWLPLLLFGLPKANRLSDSSAQGKKLFATARYLLHTSATMISFPIKVERGDSIHVDAAGICTNKQTTGSICGRLRITYTNFWILYEEMTEQGNYSNVRRLPLLNNPIDSRARYFCQLYPSNINRATITQLYVWTTMGSFP